MTEYPKIQTLFERDPITFKLREPLAVLVPDFLAVDCWDVEEKLDGMNLRIIVDREAKSVQTLGRTDRAQLPQGILDATAFIERQAQTIPVDADYFILFGEGLGPKVNGNRHQLTLHEFFLFDVHVGRDRPYWLSREEVRTLAMKIGCRIPPGGGLLTTKDCVEQVRANITTPVSRLAGGRNYVEGVVCRPVFELQTQRGQRVIWKLKCKDFAKKEAVC